MARTFIRQDTQIRSSDVYDDTIAPNLANFETNPTEIEGDLNNQRSMLSELRDVRAGNWYDALVAPVTLETGTIRGVQDLNGDLHLLEKKRVLRDVHSLVDITVPASAAAAGTLTNATNFLDTETVTIDAKVYTFQTSLTDVDGNVNIGASVALSHENLRRAINLDGVAGTDYATSMTLHPTVSASDTATTTVVTAKSAGTAGNAIATTETTATGSWGGALLTGGDGDVVILAAGELPSNTTAAVGIVTTLGTVVVAHGGTFGEHSLDQIDGPNDLNPKNLITLFDGTTRDTLQSGGNQIWGLLQGESGLTDGTTITDTTATRVQIAFVKVNGTGDDLIIVPAVDIGGTVLNYCYRERIRLEDLSEGDFLKGSIVDTPGAATAVDRQDVYDNQGVTPVELTTNASLDLATGVEWSIRDLANADLFQIIEGSGGGTSEFAITADVDLYDNDAADVNFANGASINSGGTRPIDVGVTDGVVESTAGDLRLLAAAEMLLDDVNQAGSTWAQTEGIKLSETTAEWDAYEVEFGEVSLLNAIVQASNQGGIVKACANVSSTTTADNDVSQGDGNLDAALGDLSGGDFVNDHDVYLNGALLRSGANAAANNDVYPGTDLNNTADGQLKFEFPVRTNDVICTISRA